MLWNYFVCSPPLPSPARSRRGFWSFIVANLFVESLLSFFFGFDAIPVRAANLPGANQPLSAVTDSGFFVLIVSPVACPTFTGLPLAFFPTISGRVHRTLPPLTFSAQISLFLRPPVCAYKVFRSDGSVTILSHVDHAVGQVPWPGLSLSREHFESNCMYVAIPSNEIHDSVFFL